MHLTSKNGNEIILQGWLVDDKTRCKHYHSDLDIIAIKFKCCGIYYPCYKCHEEYTVPSIAGHDETSRSPSNPASHQSPSDQRRSQQDQSWTTQNKVHKLVKWDGNDKHELVILCGNCKTEMTFNDYSSLICKCGGKFNPGCKYHYHLYFESSLSCS